LIDKSFFKLKKSLAYVIGLSFLHVKREKGEPQHEKPNVAYERNVIQSERRKKEPTGG
jgi:hypothetical protein